MKLAIVADVHGNLAALEAVLADLDRVEPDRVVLGGDLALNGPRPAECLALIRERGWEGILGNTDEVLWARPDHPGAGWTRSRLGESDLAWLRSLPQTWRDDAAVGLVHAVPGDLWRAVRANADDEELRRTYGALGTPLTVYCHIHVPYVRRIDETLTVANTGSVGMPFDGDPRASYLLVADGEPATRRVAYDVERAVHDLGEAGHPLARELATAYRAGRPPRSEEVPER
ncbi:MAG: metallophosphoesterase family protein [Candidatus Dormibacteraceae bacterium]